MERGKAQRQESIRSIVSTGNVGTQTALLKLLRGRGVRVDQSTLSRDLQELGVTKRQGLYVLPEATATRRAEPALDAAVLSYTACGPHMIVIRTVVGAAQALAVKIDNAAEPSIAGTLAGDDSIFLATKNRRSQAVALRRLEQWFGDRHER
jgi:transcriptional regulator of arginine metabolism